MGNRVVVLGAGFGGLELSSILSEEFGGDIDVVLIDKTDGFVFGFSKLDVMFGRTTLPEVQIPYGEIAKPGVEFRQETITAIDPERRRVVTDVATYDADVGAATLFAVNRSVDEPIELLANVRALGQGHLVEATTLCDSDIRAHNTEETPDRVVPRPLTDITSEDGFVRALLPPVSWSVIRLTKSSPSAPAGSPNPKE